MTRTRSRQDAPLRRVTTRPPSFPEVPPDTPLPGTPGPVWQVLAGDRDHWRVGLYSPRHTSAAEVRELETHDCPELFVLLSGSITLVLGEEAGLRELPLLPGQPVLVSAPHDGFCPAGPGTGVALVVERDSFDTCYWPAR